MARQSTRRGRKIPWPLVWLIQVAAAFALGLLAALSALLGGVAHGLFLWALMPLGGMAAGCLATLRGLNNYLAWLAPPLMEIASSLLIWGYSPAVGPVFLCGFLSLVGAAAGEVCKRQGRR